MQPRREQVWWCVCYRVLCQILVLGHLGRLDWLFWTCWSVVVSCGVECFSMSLQQLCSASLVHGWRCCCCCRRLVPTLCFLLPLGESFILCYWVTIELFLQGNTSPLWVDTLGNRGYYLTVSLIRRLLPSFPVAQWCKHAFLQNNI